MCIDESRNLGGKKIVFGYLLCLAMYIWCLGPVEDFWCVFGGLGFSVEVVCCVVL